MAQAVGKEHQEGVIMKERIEKYIKKKQRERALKMLKDNIPVILGVLGLIILLIVLKILKKKAKKKVKAKIKETIKSGIDSIRDKESSSDGDEEEEE